MKRKPTRPRAAEKAHSPALRDAGFAERRAALPALSKLAG